MSSKVNKNPDALTQITASDTHPLTFTNWEPCTWLGVALVASTLCSRDTASCDHACPSGLLATTYNGFENASHVDVYTELSALTASMFNP